MVLWMSICEKGELDLRKIIEEVMSNKRFSEVGGIASFLGVVRSTSSKGEKADHLEFEAYNGKVDEVLTKISEDIKKRPGIVEVLIRHVVGKLRQGELIMAVVVAGKSRVDVFPALAEAVERTKKEAPIWKKEVLSSGQANWVSYK